MNESFRVEKLKEEIECMKQEMERTKQELAECVIISKAYEELQNEVRKLISEKEMLKDCIVKMTMEKHGVY